MFQSKLRMVFAVCAICVFALSGCNEDTTAGVTKITIIPEFVLSAGDYIIVEQGGMLTDLGVQAFEGETELEVTLAPGSEVDTDVPGIYFVTFEAVNSDGFEITQDVIINVVSEDISGFDISGVYNGSGFGGWMEQATFTKLDDGLFFCNRALASGNNVPAYVYWSGGGLMQIPGNSSIFGTVGAGAAFPGTFVTYNDVTGVIQWVVYVSCCGNFGPITFVPV